MLFNSFEFFIFLPIIFVLYWFVFKGSYKQQNILVLLSSYFFYGWFDWRFVGLLILSTVIDYSFGYWIENGTPQKKKALLWLSIFNNLIILGFFKYYNFFTLEFTNVLNHVGFHLNPYIIKIALPLGISFYTFHGMSYVVDIYRGILKPTKNFVDYAMFVCFFPLLVAGPIERGSHLLPQISKPRKFNYSQAVQGLRLMLWGFIKKVAVADNLAPVVDDIFKHYHTYSGSTLVLGAIYFSFQIYCDFSGYTDIAIGIAKLFGFELLTNFKFPYFSRNMAEFWRRWHISLSSWFRDYLYIPLGGGRVGKVKAVRNTFIIFLVSGFWHGANWTFITWGGLHAVLFIPLLLGKKNRQFTTEVVAYNKLLPSIKELLQMLSTFVLATFAWVFFRAPTISFALDYLKHIGHNFFQIPQLKSFLFIYVLPLIVVDWYLRNDERNLRVPKNKVLRYTVYVLLFYILIYYSNNNASFIYFQF